MVLRKIIVSHFEIESYTRQWEMVCVIYVGGPFQ